MSALHLLPDDDQPARATGIRCWRHRRRTAFFASDSGAPLAAAVREGRRWQARLYVDGEDFYATFKDSRHQAEFLALMFASDKISRHIDP
jgi:hypothetical protein